jgi:FkbM family methyltransferase
VGRVSQNGSRAARKAGEIRAWAGSVQPSGWPAALLLAMCRTRPPMGDGVVARTVRRLFPRVRLHPSTLRGLWTAIDPSQPAQFVVYDEIFIKRVYDLSLVCFEPDLIVDCGAFEGYFSLLARARFPDAPIVAFEPHPLNFEGLRLHATQRPDLRIDVRRMAVSTVDGQAPFEGGGCGGRISESAMATRVEVQDLRRVIGERNPQRLLLKMDVEGEEARLLPALLPTLPRRCAIFVEWHHGPESYAALAGVLSGCGFTMSVLREHDYAGTIYLDVFAQRT